jgi:hypothetical protein
VRQLARFGSADQREEATAVLQDTVRRLYEVLARPAGGGHTDGATGSDAEPDDDTGTGTGTG